MWTRGRVGAHIKHTYTDTTGQSWPRGTGSVGDSVGYRGHGRLAQQQQQQQRTLNTRRGQPRASAGHRAGARAHAPRLHYRLLTLCPAPTDPVPRGQLWPIGSVYVCMYMK